MAEKENEELEIWQHTQESKDSFITEDRKKDFEGGQDESMFSKKS